MKSFQHVGDIIMAAFYMPPKWYAACAGQTMSIAQNNALYSILGTRYGGNGTTYFVLPDLRGRVPIGAGQGPGLTVRNLGVPDGAKEVTLTARNLPPHTHTVREDRLSLPVGDNNNTHNPTGAYVGASAAGNLYSTIAGTGVTANMPATLTIDNGVAAPPVDNMQPYLSISFFIVLAGIYPSRG